MPLTSRTFCAILRLLLPWLIAWGERRPYYDLKEGDGYYMRRWWLLGGSHPQRDQREDEWRCWRRGKLDAWIGNYVGIRLHHICREDLDPDMHDHPWDFRTFIIKGSYLEQLPRDQAQSCRLDPFSFVYVQRWPGASVRHAATDRHRIASITSGGVWTLFVMFGKQPETWGFYCPERGKVPWREYETAKKEVAGVH